MSENRKRRRVMFICSVSPFPKSVGKTLMTGGICEFLRDSELVAAFKLVCCEPVPPGYGVSAEVLPMPGLLRKIGNVLFYSALLRVKSLQESFFWSPKTMESLARSLEEFGPDVIVYDTVRTGQFLHRTPQSQTRHILYMDDLFSVRYDRILTANREYPSATVNALGNFSAKLPWPLMAFYERVAWLRTSLLKTESSLVSATEAKCPANFDKCLLVSKAEQDTLQERTGARNIYHIPPRIERPSSRPQRTWNGDPDFVFLGTLNLSHNAFGIEHFLANGFESILKQIPEMKLFIVGRGASENLVRLAEQFAGRVELMGFVEDVDAVLMRCCAMICPLLFGSGIKLKAIDALRCGVPLISTPSGVEGIDVGGTSGVMIVETPNEFRAAMLDFLRPESNRLAGNANLEAFQRSYSRNVVDLAYQKAFLEDM
jgi:polysaccharide biosynthesis protein PslH